jgi:hypothetical protein
MKKSIIVLLALTSSYVYAAETVGTIVSIHPATKVQTCASCGLDEVRLESSTDLDIDFP